MYSPDYMSNMVCAIELRMYFVGVHISRGGNSYWAGGGQSCSEQHPK
jgi:hypothetical protein